MSVHVRREHGGILVCELNNPERRNALTGDMLAALITAFQGAQRDDAVRAVAIRGAHGMFCSGRDLGELKSQDASRQTPEATIAPVTQLAHAILHCPVPTVAIIEGKAVGLGVALASWCDIAMASDSASFLVPEARAGVTPTYTAVSLTRMLGRRRALALCLTGQPLSAQEALAYGLVHFVHPGLEFEAHIENMFQSLRKGGPQALRGCKALLERSHGLPFKEVIALAAQTSIEGMHSAEAEEGMRAFKQRRSPTWYGDEH